MVGEVLSARLLFLGARTPMAMHETYLIGQSGANRPTLHHVTRLDKLV